MIKIKLKIKISRELRNKPVKQYGCPLCFKPQLPEIPSKQLIRPKCPPTPHPWPICTPWVNLGKKKKGCKERKRDFASLHLHNMKEDAR